MIFAWAHQSRESAYSRSSSRRTKSRSRTAADRRSCSATIVSCRAVPEGTVSIVKSFTFPITYSTAIPRSPSLPSSRLGRIGSSSRPRIRWAAFGSAWPRRFRRPHHMFFSSGSRERWSGRSTSRDFTCARTCEGRTICFPEAEAEAVAPRSTSSPIRKAPHASRWYSGSSSGVARPQPVNRRRARLIARVSASSRMYRCIVAMVTFSFVAVACATVG